MLLPGRHAERRAARRSGTCGWPRILHGGVTAAAADEAFGFLLLSLRRAGELPFLAPAFTARLEVNYHKVRRRAGLLAIAGKTRTTPGCQRPQGAAPVVPLSLLDCPMPGGLVGCYCRLWTLWHRRVLLPPLPGTLVKDICVEDSGGVQKQEAGEVQT